MNIDAVKADLMRDEGVRNTMYLDSLDVATIGVGHNLQEPISERAISVILEDDLANIIFELNARIPWWQSAPEPVQRGLLNMAFNLGWPRLSKFQNMLVALKTGDYELAADEALDSKWASQVGDRAGRVATLFRSA